MYEYVFIVLPQAESEHLARVLHKLVPIEHMHNLCISNHIVKLVEAEARQLLAGSWKTPHTASAERQLASLVDRPLTVFKVGGKRVEDLVKQSGVDLEHVYIYTPLDSFDEPSKIETTLLALFSV